MYRLCINLQGECPLTQISRLQYSSTSNNWKMVQVELYLQRQTVQSQLQWWDVLCEQLFLEGLLWCLVRPVSLSQVPCLCSIRSRAWIEPELKICRIYGSLENECFYERWCYISLACLRLYVSGVFHWFLLSVLFCALCWVHIQFSPCALRTAH